MSDVNLPQVGIIQTFSILRMQETVPGGPARAAFMVLGRQGVGDVSAGIFVWSPQSSASDDDVNVLTPNDRPSSNGRWVRVTDAIDEPNDLVGFQFFGTNLGNGTGTLFLKTDATGSLASSTFNNSRYMVGQDCVLTGLRVEFVAAAGGGANATFTVQVDGIDTGIVVSIPNGQTFGTSDVEVEVLRDQAVAVKSVASAADATAIHIRAVIPLRLAT